MRRREFITLFGATAGWCFAARAQQAAQIRRVAVLMNLEKNDPQALAEQTLFAKTLQQLGWTEGANVQIDYRWSTGDPDEARKNIAAVLANAPDVILSTGAHTAPLLQSSRNVPVVFVLVVDPVGAGIVDSLAHPGGNATGFTQFEYGTAGKWLDLLKEAVPGVTQVAVIRDPSLTSGTGQFGAIQAVAGSHGVELKPVNVGDPGDIERVITSLGSAPHGGLIVTASPLASVHRSLIVTLATKHRLPAVYPERTFAIDGGLISYGSDFVGQYRLGAGYVDRILRGEKPANLPVQAPTKYQLIINLKTAKALGLSFPATLLATADEVIE